MRNLCSSVLFDRGEKSVQGIENLSWSSIHALQFIVIDGGKDTELNIITGDGRRIHLYSGTGAANMEERALSFAEFLNTPIVRTTAGTAT